MFPFEKQKPVLYPYVLNIQMFKNTKTIIIIKRIFSHYLSNSTQLLTYIVQTGTFTQNISIKH